MANALLDVIYGNYANGQAVVRSDDEDSTLLSIRSHLSRLLNTRQGSVPHLPDYGLPDIALYYQGLPNSVSELTALMKLSIEKYEPRLEKISVKHKQDDDKSHVIHLNISGTIKKQQRKAHYSTYFLSGGGARVEEKSY